MLGAAVSKFRTGGSAGGHLLLAMALGGAAGLIVGEPARVLDPFGQLFVRLLVTAAVPLALVSLLAAVTALKDPRLLAPVGAKFLGFVTLSTASAVLLGAGSAELLRSGVGIMASPGIAPPPRAPAPGLVDLLYQLIPQNIFVALGEGRMLQVIVFAILLGAAALAAPTDVRLAFHKGASVLDAVLRNLVALIMRAAPFALAALSASAAARLGAEMAAPLALLVAGVWSAQLVTALLMLAAVALVARTSPLRFLRVTAPLYATAAATCSSLASFAVAIRLAEERLRLPQPVYSLTLSLGAQISKEGTAVTLGAVLVFAAQAAGVRLTAVEYVALVAFGLLLAGASGGIPGGGLVKALILVEAFNLPLEAAGLIAAVYWLLDIGNTTTNVLGDMVAARVVAALEGFRDEDINNDHNGKEHRP